MSLSANLETNPHHCSLAQHPLLTKPAPFAGPAQIIILPVASAVHIFVGALLSLQATTGNNGYARPVRLGANLFAGIAAGEVDNSHGADGDRNVLAYTSGDWTMPISPPRTASAQTRGLLLYAVDDDTVQTAPALFIGQCIDVVDTSNIIIRLNTFGA